MAAAAAELEAVVGVAERWVIAEQENRAVVMVVTVIIMTLMIMVKEEGGNDGGCGGYEGGVRCKGCSIQRRW